MDQLGFELHLYDHFSSSYSESRKELDGAILCLKKVHEWFCCFGCELDNERAENDPWMDRINDNPLARDTWRYNTHFVHQRCFIYLLASYFNCSGDVNKKPQVLNQMSKTKLHLRYLDLQWTAAFIHKEWYETRHIIHTIFNIFI